MKIENWSIIVGGCNPYTAPELLTSCLYGKVYGHPRFPDGSVVTTSSIVGLRSIMEEIVITKSGSFYELGVVNSLYETAYPNAKKRLLKSLIE